MNRRTLGLAFTAVSLTALAMGSTAQAATDEAAVVAAQVEKLRLAMLSRDKAVLDNLMADELTYGHSDRRVQTKGEMINAIITGSSTFNAITISEQTIRIVGDLAIVRHRFEGDTVSGGKVGHPDIRILQVWQKRAGEWKLLVRQAH